MSTPQRRPFFVAAVALDLILIASGVAGLIPSGSDLVLAPFVAAIAAVAWLAGAEGALGATACAVVALAIRLGSSADTTLLTILAATGAILSLAIPSARNLRLQRQGTATADATAPPALAMTFVAISLPLLAVIVYANVADRVMRQFSSAPSPLQPLLVLLGFAVWKLRRTVRPSEILLQPVTLLMSAYCFFLFASSIWAGDTYLTDERFLDTVKNLAIFVIAGSLAISWTLLNKTLKAVTVAAALLSLLTIFQTVTGSGYTFGGFASTKVGNVYGEVADARASGPFDDPNFYGQLLLLALPLAGFVAWTEQRWSRRALWIGAMLAITAATLLTYSRGAMLALAIIAMAALYITRVRVIHLVPAILLLVVTLAVLPSAVSQRLGSLQQALPGQGAVADSSIEERKLFLACAVQMFSEHPLAGVGAGNYSTYYNHYADLIGSPARLYLDRGDVAYPHNLYLQIASETGVIGLALFLSAMTAAFVALRRARRRLAVENPAMAPVATAVAIALLAYLVTAIFLHGDYQRDLWLILAFAAATVRLAAAPPPIAIAV